MSERMTSISLPGVFGSGIADYGRCEPSVMVAQLRAYAEHQRALAEQVLAASDDDFRIETYVGKWVEKQKEVIQEGRVTAKVDAHPQGRDRLPGSVHEQRDAPQGAFAQPSEAP